MKLYTSDWISRSSSLCRCDADCSDFGDCCFDWARRFHNETESLNIRSNRFQCRRLHSNVSNTQTPHTQPNGLTKYGLKTIGCFLVIVRLSSDAINAQFKSHSIWKSLKKSHFSVILAIFGAKVQIIEKSTIPFFNKTFWLIFKHSVLRVSQFSLLRNCFLLFFQKVYVYMINYCPEGTSNLNVIEKCQEDTGYLQAIPVHSRDTDLVYSNIFCALCHDDVNLTISRGTVRCNNEDLLKNCGISPFDHILLPQFHLKNTLTWTRLLGK